MVFYETDWQGAKPHGVTQERLLKESRGLRNLCGCKVQGAYDIGLFVPPRVRTPCGHGAQVIVEGREEQTDGGEGTKTPKPTQTKHPSPQAETPPSCSLSSTLSETCETETSGN